jgi:phosphatidylglycerol:prolipoprotein diacylglycerol transferase
MSSFGWGTIESGKSVRISQLLAVCIILAAITIFIVRRRRSKEAVYYSDSIVLYMENTGIQNEVQG